MTYAQVIVKTQVPETDRIFTYRVPEALQADLKTGMMVRVPFGSANHTIDGFVLKLTGRPNYPENRIKSIERILGSEPVFGEAQLSAARWIQERYLSSLSSALSLFVPRDPERLRKEVRYAQLLRPLPEEGAKERLGKTQRIFLKMLSQQPQTPLETLVRESGIGTASRKTLEEKGFIRILTAREIEKDEELPALAQEKDLNEEQQAACSAIEQAAQEGRHPTFLLYGITGSGKTEVYIRTIRSVVERGKSAFLLVPEISLTPQLSERLKEHFGSGVILLHSRMNDTERSRAWERIRHQKACVVAGPRSALFAPVKDPGLIILDEEHEASYKSDIQPRYHAREVAQYMAQNGNFPVVLGSATPSVETYARALSGEYTLLRLRKRAVSGALLPQIRLVDMRAELAGGNFSPLSGALHQAIRERLSAHEQVMLLMNRKGYASSVSCRSCGFVLRCPACFLPYTYHKDKNTLICHHCGKEVHPVTACPSCSSPYIRYFGSGTQKVEEMIRQEFPEASVLRMDADTTSAKNAFSDLYRQIRDHKADIIVGTQMIAKGLDIPDVTLVGVMNADQTLFYPDYHSSERTYQLLTQVAGRAGRGTRPGLVLIQTYDPEHYVLQSTASHNDQRFYKEEMFGRQLMKCPPYASLIQILLFDKNEERTVRGAFRLKEILDSFEQIDVLGPSPAELGRIDNTFRWKILVRSQNEAELIRKVREALKTFSKEYAGLGAVPDLNPAVML